MRPLHFFVAFFAVAVLMVGFFVFLSGTAVPAVKTPALNQKERVDPQNHFPLYSFAEATSGTTAFLENDTRSLAEEIGKEIIVKNPDGPIVLENKEWIRAVEPEELTEKMMATALEQFQEKEFAPEINPADLRLATSDTPQTQTLYFKAFRDILNYNFQTKPLDFSGDELKGLPEVITAYEQAVADFYNLEVPASLTTIHQQEISLLIGQKRVFEALSNYKEDPLQAVLAGRVLVRLKTGFTELNELINEFIQKNNLRV